MISPTDKGVRLSDRWGSGKFGASRDGGKRIHRGADYICEPGQPVRAPVGGFIKRQALPYSGSALKGLVLQSGVLTLKLFYLTPIDGIVGQWVEQGQLIAIADDISANYPGMTPHIHLAIIGANGQYLDPELLIRVPEL